VQQFHTVKSSWYRVRTRKVRTLTVHQDKVNYLSFFVLVVFVFFRRISLMTGDYSLALCIFTCSWPWLIISTRKSIVHVHSSLKPRYACLPKGLSTFWGVTSSHQLQQSTSGDETDAAVVRIIDCCQFWCLKLQLR
jgi:hypothetical protein